MSILLLATLGLLVGLTIGTLGGGGGLLTVPILIYLLDQTPADATTGSVVIVGIISLAGVLSRLRGHTIDWRTGLILGALGIPAAWAGSLASRSVPNGILLGAFAVLTLTVATLMVFRRRSRANTDRTDGVAPSYVTATPRQAVYVFAAGTMIGFLTGFLGVGGGFLVVPVLTILLGLSMTASIATSLLVLTVTSATSLIARLDQLDLDWSVIGPFAAVAVFGALAGKPLADRLSATALNHGFVALLLLVGGLVGLDSLLATI
ncbi:sulfite exporter TauE/SafE family protein [Amycolatopsis thailandensis]|uniref:sulfite exporter TauE/SafE family protein n=1 Tax=Amycolatopsis thailandensis TaxID=589330 RepID=UPI00363EF43A